MCRVVVFTGFLASGKTTIILSLLSQLPKDLKVCLIKNEYGENSVDSLLFQMTNLKVKEIVNGCLCCVLVGQLSQALIELKESVNPDCIIFESSGSAYPAPIAWQIKQLPQFTLDSIVTVIDCVNFNGYKDKSYTAKMQAQYTDLILLNKWENMSERELDDVLDDVFELNPETPKIKCNGSKGVDYKLIFGLQSKLIPVNEPLETDQAHFDEFDIITISNSIQVPLTVLDLKKKLDLFQIDIIYRIKGVIHLKDGTFILNYGFKRFTLDELPFPTQSQSNEITIIGTDFDDTADYPRKQVLELLEINQ
jgi:G3E family GTPase